MDEALSWRLTERRMDSSGRGRQRDSEEKEVEEEAHEGERLISPRPEPWDGGRPEVMDARRAGAEEDEAGEKVCRSMFGRRLECRGGDECKGSVRGFGFMNGKSQTMIGIGFCYQKLLIHSIFVIHD